jgi:hypothetical protein
VIIECLTAEFGYAVGDQIYAHMAINFDGGSYIVKTPNCTALTMRLKIVQAGGAIWRVTNESTNVGSDLTLANWRYKFVAERGW